jgi:hypothetical protein
MAQKHSIPDHMKAYEEKHVAQSFAAITRMEEKASYVIRCESPCINDLALRLWKSERSYEFETDRLRVTQECLERKDDMFGFAAPVDLLVGDERMRLDKVSQISHGFEDWIVRGVAHEVSSTYSSEGKLFHRMLLPIGKDHEQDYRSYVETKGIHIGSIYRGAGIIKVNLKDDGLQVFVGERNGSSYLIIDSQSALASEEFLMECNAVLLALGFLTGYLPRNERYVIQSPSRDRVVVSGLCYTRLSDTIDSHVRVLNHAWHEEVNGKRLSWYLPAEILSSLTQMCLADERLSRTLRLVGESNALPIELRAAVYCVAMETIKDIVLEDAGPRVKPIRETSVVEHVQLKFREIVDGLDETSIGDKKALLGKIEHINQPANRRGFSQCFEHLGVTLSRRDEQCLALRDKFLHGKLPLVGGELAFMVNKLHFLVSTLVMKHVGYSGPILNNAAYHNWRLEDAEHHEPHYRFV